MCFILLNLEEHYAAQASSSSTVPVGGGGRLYLDAYEVSFPLEESIDRPPSYHLNQGQQMMDGTPRVRHMTTANHVDPVVKLRTFKFAAACTCEEILCWLRPRK